MFIWVITLKENMKYGCFKEGSLSINFIIVLEFRQTFPLPAFCRNSGFSLLLLAFLSTVIWLGSLYIICSLDTHIIFSKSVCYETKNYLFFPGNFSLKSLFSPLLLHLKCSIVFTSYFQSMRLLKVVFRLECSNVV